MLRFFAVTTMVMSLALAQASVPKGASEVEPGVWKHTDAAGKTSVYRKTPFGIVKSDDRPTDRTPAPSAAKHAADVTPGASPFGEVKTATSEQTIKVVERGDMLEFERPTPFGSSKWKSKKSELNAEEREAWAKARGQQASNKTTGTKE